MPQPLTPRQQELFDLINDYFNRYNRRPMYKEIDKKMKISTQAVTELIHSIENRGWALTRFGWVEIPDSLIELRNYKKE